MKWLRQPPSGGDMEVVVRRSMVRLLGMALLLGALFGFLGGSNAQADCLGDTTAQVCLNGPRGIVINVSSYQNNVFLQAGVYCANGTDLWATYAARPMFPSIEYRPVTSLPTCPYPL